MRKKIQEKMFEFGYILELIISCVVGFAVVVLGVRLFMHTFDVTIFGSDENALVGILDGAMNLAIGVELSRCSAVTRRRLLLRCCCLLLQDSLLLYIPRL